MPPLLLKVIPQWGLREPFSMLSHLLGAFLSAVALMALVRRARQRGLSRRAEGALIIYGVSMVLVFAASALFHAPILSTEQLVPFKKLDHAAIFLMIAGTGTALYGSLRVRWAFWMIGALWVICLGALWLKMVVWPMPLWMTALTYVGVGWCGLGALIVVLRSVGLRQLRLLVAGAAVLTLGAVVFAAEWPVVWPGVIEGHEVFHVLVLVGAGIHYWFVYETCTLPDGLVAPIEITTVQMATGS